MRTIKTSQTRNPFGVQDVPNPDGNDVATFAASIQQAGPDDAVASDSDGSLALLEGENWSSRWNGGADPTIPGDTKAKWKEGNAEVKTSGGRVYIRFDWSNGARQGLIEARPNEKHELVGKYINLTDPAIIRPWVGFIVSKEKIDGRFPEGRLDFELKAAAQKRVSAASRQVPNFRVVPLPAEVAEQARRVAKAGAPDHAIVMVASPNEAPCRHCLQWARPGERVVLFPFASIVPGRPYSESGPIFVHAETCEPYKATDQYPEDFRRHRVLRAYDSEDNMIDAIVVTDDKPEAVIEKLFQNPATAFLQARSVTRGCYTFKIERA